MWQARHLAFLGLAISTPSQFRAATLNTSSSMWVPVALFGVAVIQAAAWCLVHLTSSGYSDLSFSRTCLSRANEYFLRGCRDLLEGRIIYFAVVFSIRYVVRESLVSIFTDENIVYTAQVSLT